MEDGNSSKKASNEEESDKPAVDEQPVDADNPSSSTRKRSHAEPIAHPEVPPWAAGASPARFVSLDELMSMSVALDNMALVHEIAINPSFSLPEQAEAENPLYARVKQCMHEAYWDKLREDLAKQPPVYSNALGLLAEIVLEMVPSRNVRMRAEIASRLDEPAMRVAAELGDWDWRRLTDYVIELLARLCAPVRDPLIRELRQQEDLVAIFREMFALLDLMKVDMANFTVSANRTAIEQHSARYEREQFMKYLDTVPDGASATQQWLTRAAQRVRRDSSEQCQSPPVKRAPATQTSEDAEKACLHEAYLSLLEWNWDEHRFPETLKVDEERLRLLGDEFLRLSITATAILITCSAVSREVAEMPAFKTALKDHLLVVLGDLTLKRLPERLPAVAEQCNSEVVKTMQALNKEPCKDTAKQLRAQIVEIASAENAVRRLVRDRMRTFISEMLRAAPTETGNVAQRIQPGLTAIHPELLELAAKFVRLINHNKNTFGVFYSQIMKQKCDFEQ